MKWTGNFLYSFDTSLYFWWRGAGSIPWQYISLEIDSIESISYAYLRDGTDAGYMPNQDDLNCKTTKFRQKNWQNRNSGTNGVDNLKIMVLENFPVLGQRLGPGSLAGCFKFSMDSFLSLSLLWTPNKRLNPSGKNFILLFGRFRRLIFSTF